MTGLDGAGRYIVERLLESQGMDLDKLETIRIPTAVAPKALADGSIDAAELTEPTLSRAMRPGALWLSAQDAVPDFQWGVVTYGKRLLQTDPDAGTRFMVAFRRGIEQFGRGKVPGNMAPLQQATDEDTAVLEKSCWPAFPPDGRINTESVRNYQDWIVHKGRLDRPVPIDSLWDPRFLFASDTALLRKRP